MVELLWKTGWRFLKKIQVDLPYAYGPAIPPLGIYSKAFRAGSQRDSCTPIFTAALLTMGVTCKQPTRPVVGEWISIMWSIHTTEYYSALKGKEILTPTATWVSLKEIMLVK